MVSVPENCYRRLAHTIWSALAQYNKLRVNFELPALFYRVKSKGVCEDPVIALLATSLNGY
jgi:hypothetical protein